MTLRVLCTVGLWACIAASTAAQPTPTPTPDVGSVNLKPGTPAAASPAPTPAAARTAGAAPTKPDSCDSPNVVATVDHLASKGAELRRVRLTHKQAFTVCITKTLPDAFTYTLIAIEEPPDRGPEAAGAPLPRESSLRARPVDGVHDDTYGGYLLTVTPAGDGRVEIETGCPSDKDGIPQPCRGPRRELKPMTVVLSVETRGWEVETSSGFTLGGLTDPRFFLAPDKEDGKDVLRVKQDLDAQDSYKLGVAALINLYNERWQPIEGTRMGLGFGIGVSDSGKSTYYLGPSLRFGDRATLTGGLAFGAVSTLPVGVHDKDALPATASNTLGNLPTHTRSSWFVSLSYALLGSGKDSLLKPFAPTPAPRATQAPPAASPTPTPTPKAQ